jgi:putative ABC transport system permease protein
MLSDLKFAVRSLRSTPAFTAVALIVLMLGIGATTAIYSIVDAVALRGMPFDQADRLMIVEETNPTGKGLGGGYVAAPNFYDWRAQQSSFEDLAAFQGRNLTVHDAGHEPVALRGQMVSASLFQILRVQPLRGRAFTAEHEVAGRNHVAVISDELWRSRYGADPDVIGKTFTVGIGGASAATPDNGPWEIIGVMPPGFEFPVGRLKPIEVWIPFVPSAQEYPRGDGSSRNYNAQVIGRLKPGVSRGQAYANMEQITANLKSQYPRWFRDRWVGITPLHESVVGKARNWMFLLLGSVAFVLLIACVNVANLMLARATARTRDVGVRAALGASRWQLARGLLAESLVLSAAGTLLGLAVAYWGIEIMRAALPATLPRLKDAGLDLRVLATAAIAAVATGVLFGLLPALKFSRPGLAGTLREGGRTGAAGMARERMRGALLIAEVALAVVLLVGSGLFVSSFVKLTSVDLGLDFDNVLTMRVNPRVNFSSPTRDQEMARAAVLIEDVFSRVRRIPGVEVAAFLGNGSVPLSTGWSRTTFEIAGGGKFDDPDDQADVKSVSGEYFKALRVPVLKGREFTEADRDPGAEPVVIINDIAEQRFFKGESAIGRLVKVNGDRRIVGVVKAVRLGGPEAELRPEAITPASRTSAFGGTMILRTSSDPSAIVPDVRAAVRAVLPDVVVPEAETMETMFGRLIAQRKFNTIVLALFGVLAIVIAGVGIYGVMAYLVEQRTQEIGIRMALGAQPGQVLRMVLSRASLFMAVGIAIGLAAGWMLSRFVETFLFRVEPHSVAVYAGASVLLVLAGLLAAAVPARRASKVDPMLVLR